MNVIVPKKRRDGGSSFLKLVSYLSQREDKPSAGDVVTDEPDAPRSSTKKASFDRLVDYIDRSGSDDAPVRVLEEFPDGRQRVLAGDVACETNAFSLETAAAEMNMVAAQNRHIKDPVYHFIISWREEDKPTDAQAFDSARYALKQLGLDSHQYVTAIHRDTDNVHAHVAVNRVNPLTYKAVNMWKDVEVLQKSMRVLERHYGFQVDNGPWQLNADNHLVRPGLRYPSAPQGAAKRQIFSNRESLFHYAVETVRNEINETIKNGQLSWEFVHVLLHEKGLGLREKGNGLVIYDYTRPEETEVKASSIHPSLTKARMESKHGAYQGPPRFESDDPFESSYGIFKTYQPAYEVRDKGVRAERREARADAREALKQRYQAYRAGWVKPDLDATRRRQHVAVLYQDMKADVKRSHSDPLLRKLMYRVAEFERMKAMAALRIELREERQTLAEKGLLRPMNYRAWVEQEALAGDTAAVSQLRGFVYREKRNNRSLEGEEDCAIRLSKADDSRVYDVSSHTSHLFRDGTIEYLRDGVVGVVDRGDVLQVQPGFEDYDQSANYLLAADLVTTKSGEHAEILGDDHFVHRVLEAGCRINHSAEDNFFRVTDVYQAALYTRLEQDYLHSQNSGVSPDARSSRQLERFDDNQPEQNPHPVPGA
ncbi:TraI/MobA(P) family conjugative relaxase (plasmid) [Pseudomonas sp. HR96]|uniref:TraI/MobA(P) family conjugative relaxase n=1 Tax=Pseudomonas sp. HR96 TaxID=1027966 RepID=UPI002A75A04D|nr:TraI/MobA(P) family conjugative relaxase [Pseudomonas sp. HR96]WPP02555.1 TraI/MobA(P) family conjugative relaxase [Pseudomonas sp. HR96]